MPFRTLANPLELSWHLAAAIVVCILLAGGTAHAEWILDDNGKLVLKPDFRFRFESDWDSHREDGSLRGDRRRLRVRLRAELSYSPVTEFTFGLRLRSGDFANQQSPHLTIVDLDGNPTGSKDGVLDKWFVRYQTKNFSTWAGRNSFPFWKQDEIFWDDTVTVAGAAMSYAFKARRASLAFNAGFFSSPDGAVNWKGQFGGAQVVGETLYGPVQFTAAGAFYRFFGKSGAEHLRNGNGEREYAIWIGSLQSRFKAGNIPLRLGLDFMHNSYDYSPSDRDPFTARHFDQKDGFAVTGTVGQLSKAGDISAAYLWGRIEALSIHASYAQDDMHRWGGDGQTDSSDFKGHEFRVGVALARRVTLIARLFFAEALTSVQDGKRFRVDFNYGF